MSQVPDYVIALLLKPLVVLGLTAFLLRCRQLVARYCPHGRLRNLLLKEVWLTDPEREELDRLGLLPPKPIRARSLAWQTTGFRFGRWVRAKLRQRGPRANSGKPTLPAD